jgi:hypothetical protein
LHNVVGICRANITVWQSGLTLQPPNKGEPIAVLDQLRDIQSCETQISFLNYLNSSSHPHGDWWGADVLLTVTIDIPAACRWSAQCADQPEAKARASKPVTRWLKLHNWN